MGVLYIVSVEGAVGKTTLCAGLGVNFRNDGKKIGYLKPHNVEKSGTDHDLAFMRQLLEIEDIVNAPDIIQGRDLVLVEASIGASPEDRQTKEILGAVREMKARVITVEAFSDNFTRFTEAYRIFESALLGVVVNKAPGSQIKTIRDKAARELESAGIKLLGVMPENRVALAVTVAELAASIEGKILNNPEKADELVENYMLGALVVDSGVDYFNRKNQKAAVIRKDRPDMQLAALETPTACLVLYGNQGDPVANVTEKARRRGIPLVTSRLAADEIISKIETMIDKTRMNQLKKTNRLAELVKQNVDMKALA